MEQTKLKESLTKVISKVNGLKFRERLILLIGSIVICFFLWDTYVIQSLMIDNQVLVQKKSRYERALKSKVQEYDELLKTVDKSKVGGLSSRIDKLKSLNRNLEAGLVKFTRKLIPPNKMAQLLQEILSQQSDIKLVKLKNITETALFDKLSEEDKQRLDNYLSNFHYVLEFINNTTFSKKKNVKESCFIIIALRFNLISIIIYKRIYSILLLCTQCH